jgi:hypothetical protein
MRIIGGCAFDTFNFTWYDILLDSIDCVLDSLVFAGTTAYGCNIYRRAMSKPYERW